MKRSCKNIDIKDPERNLGAVLDCISRHYRRRDFRELLIGIGGMAAGEYSYLMESGDRSALLPAARNISEECARQIRNRELELPPCRIREKEDASTHKIRLIGLESPLQQCMDCIAVEAAGEIWRRRIVPQQASSIRGRGQVYGVRMISRFLKADGRAARYAKAHGIGYRRKAAYSVKTDIEKCYQNCRADVFLRLFRRDCASGDLLWLWESLLATHRVPMPDGGIHEGFMIGSAVSQWACQYMLSFLYRRIMSLHAERRGRQHRLVSLCVMFMDDMLLVGPSRKHLKTAVREMERYARDELGLTVKPSWQITRLSETPIDMMGYRIYQDGNASIRPRIFLRARRMALRRLRRGSISLRQARRLLSYKGYFIQPDLPMRTARIRRKLETRGLFREAALIERNEAYHGRKGIQQRAA